MKAYQVHQEEWNAKGLIDNAKSTTYVVLMYLLVLYLFMFILYFCLVY